MYSGWSKIEKFVYSFVELEGTEKNFKPNFSDQHTTFFFVASKTRFVNHILFCTVSEIFLTFFEKFDIGSAPKKKLIFVKIKKIERCNFHRYIGYARGLYSTYI